MGDRGPRFVDDVEMAAEDGAQRPRHEARAEAEAHAAALRAADDYAGRLSTQTLVKVGLTLEIGFARAPKFPLPLAETSQRPPRDAPGALFL